LPVHPSERILTPRSFDQPAWLLHFKPGAIGANLVSFISKLLCTAIAAVSMRAQCSAIRPFDIRTISMASMLEGLADRWLPHEHAELVVVHLEKEYVPTAGRHHTLAAAGRDLGVDPTPVGRRIGAIEAELGLRRTYESTIGFRSIYYGFSQRIFLMWLATSSHFASYRAYPLKLAGANPPLSPSTGFVELFFLGQQPAAVLIRNGQLPVEEFFLNYPVLRS
jgi:hypothetical protein